MKIDNYGTKYFKMAATPHSKSFEANKNKNCSFKTVYFFKICY